MRYFSKQNALKQHACKRVPQIIVCSFVVSLLILLTTKAHTHSSPFHQILTKDLIHTWLSYTTKKKMLLKKSLSSRWKSCEFLRLSCCRFPTNARMWEGIVSKGEYVTACIKSGIGPNGFLFMHGFVFWARMGGGSRVTQLAIACANFCTTKVPLPAV